MAGNIFWSLIAYTFVQLLMITAQKETKFIYNGFKESNNNLHLEGLAQIHKNGLLQLTDFTKLKTAHAFYPKPVIFDKGHLSFSTSFVFAMHPQVIKYAGHGLAFVISRFLNLNSTTLPQEYLGLFNSTSNGLPSNHIFAVELDSQKNTDVQDIDDNHVGIDVNSVISKYAVSASYYSDKKSVWKTLGLKSGKPMQVWIDYDGGKKLIDVTIGPIHESKPSKPLLLRPLDLSPILLDFMYVGFSASTGLVPNSHFILGWVKI